MADEKGQAALFKGTNGHTGPLTDSEIQRGVEHNQLIHRDTYKATCLEASSYDIRVGRKGILGGVGTEIDLQQEALELTPGSYAAVISLERLVLPSNICARIGSKRALAYEGVILLTGSIVDPGYEGHLLFGLYNASQRRVVVRHGRKLCNIVFERLAHAPNKQAPSDPDLLTGNLPDSFVDRMANMEVLPWMQISERVKQIEQITSDILDLKARYEDVLKPIRDLTDSVQSLTTDVTSLAGQTRGISDNITRLNDVAAENSRQISQLTSSLGTLVGQVGVIQDRAVRLEDGSRDYRETLTNLRTSFGRYQVATYALWALLLLGAGAALPRLISLFFASSHTSAPTVAAPAPHNP